MNNLRTYTVKFPCGNVKSVSSNIFNLRKVISSQLTNIPDDNIIIYDATLNVYSRSTLQNSSQLTEMLYVQDANQLVKEWNSFKQLVYEMHHAQSQFQVEIQQYAEKINGLQLQNGSKDSQVQELEKDSVNYEKKIREFRYELGQNQDKVKKLVLENDQIIKDKNKVLEELKQFIEERKQLIEETKLLKYEILQLETNCQELQNKLIIQEKKQQKYQSWIDKWKQYDNDFLMKCKKQNVKEEEKQIDMIRKLQNASIEFWTKQQSDNQQKLQQQIEENKNLRSQLQSQSNRNIQYKLNELNQLQTIFYAQNLSLSRAIYFMRFSSNTEGCVQDLFIKNGNLKKLLQNFPYEIKDYEIFEIEKHGDFVNHFEKLEFFELDSDRCLKLVSKGQFKIKKSQSNMPSCESKSQVGYIMEIFQGDNKSPLPNNYLLLIKSKRQDQPYFIESKDAITQSLNHIIIDTYVKEFLREKGLRQGDFKVATPYILKECESELYFYCIGVEMGDINVLNKEFIWEFKNYISTKTKNSLELGNMILIKNVMHDVVLYTKFGFLTELDRGQGGSPFQTYFQ